MRTANRTADRFPSRRVSECRRCSGSVLYDRLDEEWRCLQCGRAQAPRGSSALTTAPLKAA